jgi:hypothetical protein
MVDSSIARVNMIVVANARDFPLMSGFFISFLVRYSKHLAVETQDGYGDEIDGGCYRMI